MCKAESVTIAVLGAILIYCIVVAPAVAVVQTILN